VLTLFEGWHIQCLKFKCVLGEQIKNKLFTGSTLRALVPGKLPTGVTMCTSKSTEGLPV